MDIDKEERLMETESNMDNNQLLIKKEMEKYSRWWLKYFFEDEELPIHNVTNCANDLCSLLRNTFKRIEVYENSSSYEEVMDNPELIALGDYCSGMLKVIIPLVEINERVIETEATKKARSYIDKAKNTLQRYKIHMPSDLDLDEDLKDKEFTVKNKPKPDGKKAMHLEICQLTYNQEIKDKLKELNPMQYQECLSEQELKNRECLSEQDLENLQDKFTSKHSPTSYPE
jgi:hypothetical protein